MYIATFFGICYNAVRQKNDEVPNGHKSENPRCDRTGGFLFRFLAGWTNPRAGYRYLSPSNHLQM